MNTVLCQAYLSMIMNTGLSVYDKHKENTCHSTMHIHQHNENSAAQKTMTSNSDGCARLLGFQVNKRTLSLVCWLVFRKSFD